MLHLRGLFGYPAEQVGVKVGSLYLLTSIPAVHARDVNSSVEVSRCMKDMFEEDSTFHFDPELLKAWLTLRFNPSERCLLSKRGLKINNSRRLRPQDFKTERNLVSADDAANGLRTVLFEIVQSIAEEIPAGERIGVLSSGGIDSTALMAILCRMGFRPESFAIGFGTENDEIESAKEAADFLGIDHHARILRSILASTAKANVILDEPYRAACFYYDALKFVKDSGVRYVFDGLGVDEFFGGYDFRYRRVMDLAGSGMGRLDAYLAGSHPNDYVDAKSNMFGHRLKQVEIEWGRLLPYFDNDLSFLDQIFLADYNGKCRQNFVPLASFASSLGITLFYPWLDDRFIDFSMCVPDEWKYDPRGGSTKILFRKAVHDLVPNSTMKKRKQGFGPSASRAFEELRSVGQRVIDGTMVSNGYVNKEYYQEVLGQRSPSVIEVNKLWDLYTLETFLDEIKSNEVG